MGYKVVPSGAEQCVRSKDHRIDVYVSERESRYRPVLERVASATAHDSPLLANQDPLANTV
jgi:hypothetical protein